MNNIRDSYGLKTIFVYFVDNKKAVMAVLQSNFELIKDALSELEEVKMRLLFKYLAIRRNNQEYFLLIHA